jgi:uncharacterized membrane protein
VQLGSKKTISLVTHFMLNLCQIQVSSLLLVTAIATLLLPRAHGVGQCTGRRQLAVQVQLET